MGLLFTLHALGVKAGDQVLLPSFTFMATAQAVVYAGATPVFLEIDKGMNVSVSDLEEQLAKNKRVSAVIGIHVYGLPAKVNEIKAVVDKHNQKNNRSVKVLYDGAHAFGSAIGKNRVGTFGNAEMFTLSVTKALVSVEGGMVSNQDPTLIEKIRKMRNYGIESNYNAIYPGLNGKMSEFHAVVGLYNLKNLEKVLAQRQVKAEYYRKAIETTSAFRTIPTPKGVTHTYKDFTVMVPEALANKRAEVCAYLNEHGIDNRAYFFPPVHEQDFFAHFKTRELPVTEKLSRLCITLPFFTTMTEAQMDRVANALAESQKKIK